MDVERLEDHAARLILDERIRELLAYRQTWATSPAISRDMDVELIALLELRRKARHVTREAVLRARKAEAEYQAGDHFIRPLVDEPDVEGMPEFNGAFR